MGTEQERKPVEGEEFLKRAAQAVLRKGSGQKFQDQDNVEEDEEAKYRKKAKALEAKYEWYQSIKMLNNPPDVEALRLKREADLEAERQAAAQRAQSLEEDKIKKIEDEREEAKRKAEDERQKREAKEQELAAEKAQTVAQQIQQLKEEIQKYSSSGSGQKRIVEEIKELKDTVTELGLLKPEAAHDAHLELELAKLQYQQAREEREFKWKMRQDEKNFQLELQKLTDDREFRRVELAQQAKKDEVFASLPQRVGGAIAKGIIEGGEGEEELAPEGVTRKSKSHHIEIGEGQAGEIECPDCHTVIGVGPTSKTAFCVGCNTKFNVTRKRGTTSEEEEE